MMGFILQHFRQVLFSYFHFETLFSQKKFSLKISKSSSEKDNDCLKQFFSIALK